MNSTQTVETASSRKGLASAPHREATTVLAQRLHWVLRLGVGACFIGHGAFGIIRKPEWVPYFGVVGIPSDWAFTLMPVVGLLDIAAGVIALLSPRPIVLIYMTAWGLWTALLRPLSGDVAWETVERAGNYGVPFAFLLLASVRLAPGGWLAPVAPRHVSRERLRRIGILLTWVTALLLAGHGALAALEAKALLMNHAMALGLPGEVARMMGWFEIALAAVVVLRPVPWLFGFVLLWKLATEFLFPLTGAPVWEFIERGGSYAAPAAAALIFAHLARTDRCQEENQ